MAARAQQPGDVRRKGAGSGGLPGDSLPFLFLPLTWNPILSYYPPPLTSSLPWSAAHGGSRSSRISCGGGARKGGGGERRREVSRNSGGLLAARRSMCLFRGRGAQGLRGRQRRPPWRPWRSGAARGGRAAIVGGGGDAAAPPLSTMSPAGEGRHRGSACEERAQPPPACPDSMESVSSGIWLQATTMWNRFQFSLPKSRIGISLFVLI